jgi:hypothetical protein
MCLTSTATSHPAIQPAMPPVLLSAALLDAVQAALPLPPADAPLAWQHPSRPQLIETIAAYHPSDLLQAHLAAQIVTIRLVAEDTRWRSSAPALPRPRASSLRRMTARLTRTAAMLEHTLRRQQSIAAQPDSVPSTDAFDPAAPIAPARPAQDQSPRTQPGEP